MAGIPQGAKRCSNNCGSEWHYAGTTCPKESKGSSAASTNSGLNSAVGDFVSVEATPTAEINYPTSTYETSPLMDYLKDDPEYIERHWDRSGGEDENGPLDEYEVDDIDYSDPYVQDLSYADDEFMREDVANLAQEWYDRNFDNDPTKTVVLIQGENMGWRGVSGHKVMDADEFSEDPIGAIAPRTSEIRQEWKQDTETGELSASQSHHDRMGEKYTFTLITEEEAYEEYGCPY